MGNMNFRKSLAPVILFSFLFAPTAEAELNLPRVGIGYQVDLAGSGPFPPQPLESDSLSKKHPLYLRIRVPWKEVEREPGEFTWSRLDQIVRPHFRAGYRITLSLLGPEAEFFPAEMDGRTVREETAEAWITWVRAAAKRYRKQVEFFGIMDEPSGTGGDPWKGRSTEYGFLIKKSSVAIKSEAPEAGILIGAGAPGQITKLEAFYSGEIGPYVDVWLVRPEAGSTLPDFLDQIEDLTLRLDPSVRVWTAPASGPNLIPIPGPEGIIRQFLESAGRGAGVTLFDLSLTEEGFPQFSETILGLHRIFQPGFTRMEDRPGTVKFASVPGPAPAMEWFRFFDSDRFLILLGYFSRDGEGEPVEADVILDSWDVADLILHDVANDGKTFPDLYLPDRKSNSTAVTLPLGPGPRILQYRRFAAPEFQREGESLEVSGVRIPPVEEIIARNQEVQGGQDARLKSYMADGELTFHYQLQNSQSLVDLTYRSTFLYDREVGAEWVHRQLLWNGVPYKGKKIPNLPFVEPERVVSLPLNISLTRDYKYKLLGSDTVNGREAYLISFTPIREDLSLFKGKVWIDKTNFQKLKVSSVQTGLEAPNVSSQEIDLYRPVPTPEGDFWLLHRIEGQQILTVSGRNLVVLREFTFSNFQVNPRNLDQVRQDAYESDAPILRDTPEGFRFLVKQKDGTRVLQEKTEDRTRFWLAGVFFNEAIDFPVPLAGINFFDFNLGNSNAQLEIFSAGVFNFINITDPDLFGGPLQGGIDFTGSALQLTDRFFLGETEVEAAHIDGITQTLAVNLGLPFANFFKITGVLESSFTNYSFDEDTQAGFVTPQDTFTNSLELRGEFNRSGWSAEIFGRASKRSDWQIWGVDDVSGPFSPLEGTRFSDFHREQEDYLKYGATLSKQIFLPRFQKIRFEGNWLQGEDLDRFSKFQFSSFGTLRLRGFGGSGVRFDQGGIGRLQYSFNVADIIRFDASLDYGRVRDRTVSFGEDFQKFVGFGIGGNFVLRRGLIINFDYGIAVQSDVDGLEGEQEVQLILLRFF